ncbi:MAG: septal ring lytic transglycosylase RlpA family protein [Gammaproteobacteria bacterium]
MTRKNYNALADYPDGMAGKNKFFLAACCLLLAAMMLSGCGTAPRTPGGGVSIPGTESRDGAPDDTRDIASIPEPVPRVEPRARYGNPANYEVFGKVYHTLRSSTGYVERGIASWYGTKFHGRRTSSGEPYDLYGITAAHKSLPLPAYVRVTNLQNGRTLIVRVNDRGPFHENRVIDLSYAAASKLGILATGTGLVEVRAIDPRDVRPSATIIAGAGPQALAVQAMPLSTYSEPRPRIVPIPSSPDSVPVLATMPTPGADGGSPGLYLQLGAFQSRANAERLQTRLKNDARTGIEVVEGFQNQHTIYRVRLGPMKDVTEADNLTETITRLGLGTPLVVID